MFCTLTILVFVLVANCLGWLGDASGETTYRGSPRKNPRAILEALECFGDASAMLRQTFFVKKKTSGIHCKQLKYWNQSFAVLVILPAVNWPHRSIAEYVRGASQCFSMIPITIKNAELGRGINKRHWYDIHDDTTGFFTVQNVLWLGHFSEATLILLHIDTLNFDKLTSC